jgi:hypothetical protein
MRLGNRGEPAGDGARCQCGSAVRYVEGNGLGRRGEGRQPVITAPGLEIAPVVSAEATKAFAFWMSSSRLAGLGIRV